MKVYQNGKSFINLFGKLTFRTGLIYLEDYPMSFLKSVVISFSMFSAIPMPNVEWNEKNMRYMMAAFPLVGNVIALLWAALFVLGIEFQFLWQKTVPLHIFALIFTLIPVLITGGIHMDGFMDTSDALGSHASREKKLEILKDSHCGAFAVIGCVIYFLSYYVLAFELCNCFFGKESAHKFVNHFVQLLNFLPACMIFVISRFLSAFAVATFPIAKNSGLVHTFSSMSAKRFTAIWCATWLIIISAAMIFLFEKTGIAIIVPSILFFVFYYLTTKRNFGGITGDTAGWFVQLCEIFELVGFVVSN